MRVVHLSDLHFGHHDPRLAEGLAADIEGQNPDLVVVSGDFAQVGSEEEFVAARAFLDSLTAPFFAVPGNHDVPAINLLRRFVNPYGLYRRYIAQELEPFLSSMGSPLSACAPRVGCGWNGTGAMVPFLATSWSISTSGSAKPRPMRCG